MESGEHENPAESSSHLVDATGKNPVEVETQNCAKSTLITSRWKDLSPFTSHTSPKPHRRLGRRCDLIILRTATTHTFVDYIEF